MAEEVGQFDPGTFNFGPQRPLRPRDNESPQLVRGYYELEKAERFATEQATERHRQHVVAWYQLLDSYYRSLDLPRVSSDDEVWLTKWRILRLGLTAAKGALDAALAGYYVGAFGDIRQMTEYWFGIEYLYLNPDSVAGFYAAEPGEEEVTLPSMGARIRDVLKALSPGGARESEEYEQFARLIQKTYKRMSDGHHLDGLALAQTEIPDGPGYYLGATYHPSMAEEAFYHGTLTTGTLAHTAVRIVGNLIPNGEQLIVEIKAAMDDAIAQLDPQEDVEEPPPGE